MPSRKSKIEGKITDLQKARELTLPLYGTNDSKDQAQMREDFRKRELVLKNELANCMASASPSMQEAARSILAEKIRGWDVKLRVPKLIRESGQEEGDYMVFKTDIIKDIGEHKLGRFLTGVSFEITVKREYHWSRDKHGKKIEQDSYDITMMMFVHSDITWYKCETIHENNQTVNFKYLGEDEE